MKESGQPHSPATLPQKMRPQNPVKRKMGDPSAGLYGEVKRKSYSSQESNLG
jgi:hypothetical protein